jgi:cell division protein FtsQ
MSDFLYTDYTEFYSPQSDNAPSKDEKTGNKRMKMVKILIGILLLVVLAELAIYTIIIPCSKPAKVVFTGISYTDAKNIRNELEKSCGNTWLKFNAGMASAIIASNSSVLDATVAKKFPDKICINIHQRTPVVVTLAIENERTVPVQIDEKGVLFTLGNAIPSNTIPLLTGLPKEATVEGKRLDGLYIPLLEEISAIQNTNPEYFSALSEIHICPKQYGDFELEMYPINSKVRVRMDRNLSSDSLRYMMVVLDVLNKMNPNINEVDLRYGSVSYKTKSGVMSGGSRVE